MEGLDIMSWSEHRAEVESLDYEIRMTQSLLRAIERHRSEFRDGDRRARVYGRIHRLKRHLLDLEKKRARLVG